MEYQRVKARGQFDHSREIYIGPRWELVFGLKVFSLDVTFVTSFMNPGPLGSNIFSC
jgi:hypothetical protein